MPAMPRANKRAQKIAWNITGKPANFEDKKSAVMKKVDKELTYQETSRVR